MTMNDLPHTVNLPAEERTLRIRRIRVGLGFLFLSAIGVILVVAGALAANPFFAIGGILLIVMFAGCGIGMSLLPITGSYDAPIVSSKKNVRSVTYQSSAITWWTIRVSLHLLIINLCLYALGSFQLINVHVAQSRGGVIGGVIGIAMSLWLLGLTVLVDTGRVARPSVRLGSEGITLVELGRSYRVSDKDIDYFRVNNGRVEVAIKPSANVTFRSTFKRPYSIGLNRPLIIDPLAYPFPIEKFLDGIDYVR